MIQKLQPSNEIFTVERTIRLENEAQPAQTHTIKVTFEYKAAQRKLCFDSVLHYLCSQGYPLQGTQIFFWDNVRQIFVFIGCFPSETQLEAPYQFFQQNLIHLRYRRINKKHETFPKVQRQIVSKRVKERSIQDAYEKVMTWMRIYEQRDQNGKKLYTLEAAAKEVGVAKKTLDDYKTQIRLGKNNNFDFDKNRYEKIGILRNFNKQRGNNQRQSTPRKRPSSPQALPAFKNQMQVQQNISTFSDEQDVREGYLFHQNHSCESD